MFFNFVKIVNSSLISIDKTPTQKKTPKKHQHEINDFLQN